MGLDASEHLLTFVGVYSFLTMGSAKHQFVPYLSACRDRICKRLRNPGIDSEESILPAYGAWRAGTTNKVVVPARQAGNQFLDSLKGLQIRALALDRIFVQFFIPWKLFENVVVSFTPFVKYLPAKNVLFIKNAANKYGMKIASQKMINVIFFRFHKIFTFEIADEQT